jgi:putative tricarboxylic transport membrane protein
MIESMFYALTLVLQWPAIGYLVLGVFIGMWLGAVPGLGGIIGLIVLLPFTFNMEPVPAIALLLGMFAVVTTSDTIPSVMLGVPGTGASAATILDGYPLAKKGQAARAFGAAFTVSALGGVFGALMLAISLPIVKPIILAFGSPELFMLGILGLTMVGSISGSSIFKGLIAALLGLLLTMIGYAETVTIPRYWFGLDYLLDGVSLVPVALGLFAIPELLELTAKDTSISRVPKDQAEGGGIIDGMKDVIQHWWLALKCSAIGTYVGMLPGLGGEIVGWAAYGHAVQSAKDKSLFGSGDIRGVIAPEAANNAVKGGALIPTLAFGIPGNIGAAILLGALTIQGIRPGPDMLVDKVHITFSIVWTIVIANILAGGLLLFWSKQVAKIAYVRGHLIVPGSMLFVLMGAWMASSSIGDWITCFLMGGIGFIMKSGGWPRPPLLLAMVLGPLLENSFQISIQTYDNFVWLLRPVVLIIIALIILVLFLATKGIIKGKKSKGDPAHGEGAQKNPVVSLPFTFVLLFVFVWAGIESLKWPAFAWEFPIAISFPAALMVIITLIKDTREFIVERKAHDSLVSYVKVGLNALDLKTSFLFYGWILLIILVTMILGQMITLPLFIALYLLRWGGYSWKVCFSYAACCWLILYAFYDQILHIFWHPSWLLN